MLLVVGRPGYALSIMGGQPRFELTGDILQLPAPGRPGVLRVFVSGSYAPSQVGRVELQLPPDLVVIRGELTRTVHTHPDSADSHWDVVFEPSHYGLFRITGSLSVDVDARYGRDEMEFEMELYAGQDTTWERPSHALRYERVVGSQRYRYGGDYLVPIAQSERVVIDDIVQPAEVVQSASATCGSCSLSEANSSVRMLVFLDASGKIVETKALPRELPTGQVALPDSDVIAAARETLRNWSFSASRTATMPVADFVIVYVDVRH
jgi:hypothetical protein